jgi:uncharacterized membrane protein YphA (DoxX/SURF4 family)
LSIAIGTFILFMGISKWSWLTDSGVLASRFQEWLETAPPTSRWYLQMVAIPGTPIFARLVPIAEIALGAALILGLKTRLALAVGGARMPLSLSK